MAKIYYDPKVEELARYFLTGAKQGRGEFDEGRVTRLAEQIQQTIEDFLKYDW